MSPRTPDATAVLRALRQHADPERARHQARYFRTGAGEYGEGDRFLGITVPQTRSVVRRFRGLSLGEIERLLESPWHEARLAAVLLLAAAYPKADASGRQAVYRLYLRRTDRINNWDLVDVTAPGVVGRHLEGRSRKVLHRLIRSRSLWERRIALLATAHFIRLGQYDDTIALVTATLDDREDLIHKASGWMLREVGQHDPGVLRRFLARYASRMPRTMLRYAIEKLPPAERRRWLVGSRAGARPD
jgi:3-methyladenine DNA glycosylase AlkD